jgi:acid phosphatase
VKWLLAATGAVVAALAAVGLAAVLRGHGARHVPHLDHVVVVVFENEERSAVVDASQAPTFTRYADEYADLTDYSAIAHPSLPNYLALVSGSTQGVTSDCTDCGPWPTSIGTALTQDGLAWGGYAEGYPSSPLFAKRHVPFLYFTDAQTHVHPLSGLDPAHLPAYVFVTPNLCNDGHSCPLHTADTWLAHFLPTLLHVPRTAVFVVFDEGTTDSEGGGNVFAFAAGTAVRTGVTSNQDTDHYGLLRTTEDALRLPPIGEAEDAKPLTGIWR